MALFGRDLYGGKYYTYAQDGVLRVWDSASSSWLRDVSSPDLARDKVYAVAGCDIGSPGDGNYAVYMGAQSGSLYWWSSTTNAVRRVGPPPTASIRPLHSNSSAPIPAAGAIRSCSLERGGEVLVTLSSTGVACTWALGQGTPREGEGPGARKSERAGERAPSGEPKLMAAVALRRPSAQEFSGFLGCAHPQPSRVAFVVESTLFVTDLGLRLVNSRPLASPPSCVAGGAGLIAVGSSTSPFLYVYLLGPPLQAGQREQRDPRDPRDQRDQRESRARAPGQAQEIFHISTINVASPVTSVALRAAPAPGVGGRPGQPGQRRRRASAEAAAEVTAASDGGAGDAAAVGALAAGAASNAPARLFYVAAASKRAAQVFLLPYRRLVNPETHGQQIFAAACVQHFSAAPADKTIIFSIGVGSVSPREEDAAEVAGVTGALGEAGHSGEAAHRPLRPQGEKRRTAVSASRDLVSSIPASAHAVGLSLLRGTVVQPVMDALTLLGPQISAPFAAEKWQSPKTVLRPLRADVVARAQTADAVLQCGGSQPSLAPSHVSVGSAALRYFGGLQESRGEGERVGQKAGDSRDARDAHDPHAAERDSESQSTHSTEEESEGGKTQPGNSPRSGPQDPAGHFGPATSLEQLLRQGDRDRIREMLLLSTPAEIAVRTRSLTNGAVVLLLRRLADYCSEPGAPGVRSALQWVRGVCRERRGFLSTSPEAQAALGAVERSMDARMGYYPLLQRIHDAIYANINRIEDSRAMQDPLVTLNLFTQQEVREDFGEGVGAGSQIEDGSASRGFRGLQDKLGETSGEDDSDDSGDSGELSDGEGASGSDDDGDAALSESMEG